MINQLIKIKRRKCLYLLTSDIETYRLSIVFKKDLDKNIYCRGAQHFSYYSRAP